MRICLEAASAAPSIHNTQPWLFRLRDGGIDILADRRRRLEVIDPQGRELLISVAAAVLNARVAMLGCGWVPILRVFPNAAQPDLVARITPGPAAAPDPTVRALAAAIGRRRTNRRPFSDLPLPDPVVTELTAAAAAEGAVLATADTAGTEAVLALTRTADEWQRADPAYREELAAWTLPPRGRSDGVPAQAFGPQDERDTLPMRDFGLVQPDLHRRNARFEPDPTLVVLSTEGDGRLAWVRAGQALQRVLLTAAVRGVAAAPMTQALEEPLTRQLISDQAHNQYAQVILRLGYGRATAASPRRPLAETLIAEPRSAACRSDVPS
ncbi:Acg family FMN-binding oxidoreductase [Rugosimonospora africana]|uniref:Nitroreductase domain-containing protein n=1 Tax=Rugosimonospora africana TaxID=556532 RepID=A0A8J3VVW3_9ACTN|nr:nitroreductase family protein [Rugosimonospora africana]GIH21102.1 hypothetical protein Raf01_92740 [Rugosimonospora africana]